MQSLPGHELEFEAIVDLESWLKTFEVSEGPFKRPSEMSHGIGDKDGGRSTPSELTMDHDRAFRLPERVVNKVCGIGKKVDDRSVAAVLNGNPGVSDQTLLLLLSFSSSVDVIVRWFGLDDGL